MRRCVSCWRNSQRCRRGSCPSLSVGASSCFRFKWSITFLWMQLLRAHSCHLALPVGRLLERFGALRHLLDAQHCTGALHGEFECVCTTGECGGPVGLGGRLLEGPHHLRDWLQWLLAARVVGMTTECREEVGSRRGGSAAGVRLAAASPTLSDFLRGDDFRLRFWRLFDSVSWQSGRIRCSHLNNVRELFSESSSASLFSQHLRFEQRPRVGRGLLQ